ncbi:MAG: hypothetical protein ACRC1P_05645 [Cellulosilyticaceae bacterium]
MAYLAGSAIAEELPEEVMYFKEKIICDTLDLPMHKPPMERLLGVVAWPEVGHTDLIETYKGKSFEGQRLTGVKLGVEVNVKVKLTYVAQDKARTVHAVYYDLIKSTFVTLPEYVEGKKICDLVRANKLTVAAYIEDICARMIDEKSVHQSLMLLIDVRV